MGHSWRRRNDSRFLRKLSLPRRFHDPAVCDTGKYIYKSKAAARGLAAVQNERLRALGETMRIRAYKCPGCGHYHTTSQAPRR